MQLSEIHTLWKATFAARPELSSHFTAPVRLVIECASVSDAAGVFEVWDIGAESSDVVRTTLHSEPPPPSSPEHGLLRLPESLFIGLADGSENPQHAFVEGRARISGNPFAVLPLTMLFDLRRDDRRAGSIG